MGTEPRARGLNVFSTTQSNGTIETKSKCVQFLRAQISLDWPQFAPFDKPLKLLRLDLLALQ